MRLAEKRWLAGASVVAFNVVFVAGLWLLPRHSWPSLLWANVFWTIASAGCAIELFRVSRHLPKSRERRAWVCFGAGAFSWFLGILVWSWFELIRGKIAPVATIAALGFIGMAPCFAVGTSYLRTALPPKHHARVFLSELGIAVLLIVLLCGAFLYRPVQQFTGPPLYLAALLTRAVVYAATALFALISILQGTISLHPRVASLLLAGFGAFAGCYFVVAYAYTAHLDEESKWVDMSSLAPSVLFSLQLSSAFNCRRSRARQARKVVSNLGVIRCYGCW